MVIDFHTHIFPDDLAKKAVTKLRDNIDGLYQPVHDGTLSGLLGRMDAYGIDVSVIQPVVTKKSQTRRVNEWAASIQSDRIVGFGGLYPHDGYKEDIDRVVGLGLKGLKFHAEYQDFTLDEPRMLRIYDYALSRGLVLLHHAGFDPGFPPPFKTSPERFTRVAKQMRGGVIIASHLGGHAQWDEVEETLAGSGVWLDTSMGFEYYPHAQFMRIVRKHGADKILFATDSPWSDAKNELAALYAQPLDKREADAIAGGNALRLLNL